MSDVSTKVMVVAVILFSGPSQIAGVYGNVVDLILADLTIVDASEYVPQGYEFKSPIDKNSTGEERNPLESPNKTKEFENPMERSRSKIFSSVLAKNESVFMEPSNKYPRTSTTTTTTTTTTTMSTTTPQSLTCWTSQEVCRIAGSLLVVSGLEWSEEMNYPSTPTFQVKAAGLAREVGRVLELSHTGVKEVFVEVEGFFRGMEGIFVDFHLELRDLFHNITREDVRIEYEDDDGSDEEKLKKIGSYVVDTNSISFLVVDPVVSRKLIEENPSESGIPSWIWLVVLSGSAFIVILIFFGCVSGKQQKRMGLATLKQSSVKSLKSPRNIWDIERCRQREEWKTEKTSTPISSDNDNFFVSPPGVSSSSPGVSSSSLGVSSSSLGVSSSSDGFSSSSGGDRSFSGGVAIISTSSFEGKTLVRVENQSKETLLEALPI